MPRRTTLTMGGLGAVAVLLLSGCASPGGTSAAAPVEQPGDYLCGGVAIPRSALEDRVPVSGMDDDARAAIASAVWDDGTSLGVEAEDGWYAASVTDERIALLRDVPSGADAAGPDPSAGHEVAELIRVDRASNVPPGWYAAQRNSCTMTVDLAELTVPDVALAPAPDPASRDLRLLVTESGCASGEDAEGRIEVVSVEETDDAVRILLGVRPRDGGQDCPGHPATPFTVRLDRPVGDRAIVDATREPGRELSASG